MKWFLVHVLDIYSSWVYIYAVIYVYIETIFIICVIVLFITFICSFYHDYFFYILYIPFLVIHWMYLLLFIYFANILLHSMLFNAGICFWFTDVNTSNPNHKLVIKTKMVTVVVLFSSLESFKPPANISVPFLDQKAIIMWSLIRNSNVLLICEIRYSECDIPVLSLLKICKAFLYFISHTIFQCAPFSDGWSVVNISIWPNGL